ncbi:DUF3304 domain-containing protein [Chromobacterium rhizoryzae]|uniref:DUF3304 domain-containing protein n=1 Tax=Chromobacterium rhizoryzae TaxID=1778675 RepID=UPI001D067A76|nr:DUF3304 domain-containing protein [Chromobacterium rhizoryzae]
MKWFSISAWLFLTLSLLGCQSMAQSKTIGAGARVVNAMPKAEIVRASFNGQAIGGSGGEECCINLPEKWQPGMTATIEWVKDPSPGVNPGGEKPPPRGKYGSITAEGSKWFERHEANYINRKVTISIPRYENTCGLSLVFMPCDEVYPVIDCGQRQKVFSNLRNKTSSEWRQEVVRRLGGRQQCQQ